MIWKQPALLWLLIPLSGLAALYAIAAFKRRPRSVVFLPLVIAAEAATHAGRVRRHLPAAVFYLALAAAIIGLARPEPPWPAPTGYPVAVIMDVSRSMDENDIKPSRIEASKTAALEFVAGLPRSSKVALVSFGNYATLVVPLTDDRTRVRDAIRNLTLQLRTQLGNGLVEGVRAVTGEMGTSSQGALGPIPPSPSAPGSSARPRAMAILLTDGRVSDGVPPAEAAAEARQHGVRVYTVGVGTYAPPSAFRSGWFGVLDEPTLREIAAITGGEYFRAAEAQSLKTIYRDLSRKVGWERRPTEMTGVMAAIAMGLLVAAVVLRSWVAPIH